MATPFFCSANSKLGPGWRSKTGDLGVVAGKVPKLWALKGLGFARVRLPYSTPILSN